MLKITVGFVISTVIDIATLPVHAVLAWTIFKHWKVFNSSYYKLFLFSSLMNVINYLNSWPILRLPNIVCKNCTFSDFYKQPTFVGLDTMRFLYMYFGYNLCFIEIIMAINRFTAIRFHWKYDMIWEKILTPSIVAAVILPVFLAYPSYIYPSYSRYYEPMDYYLFYSTEEPVRRALTFCLVELIFSLSVLIIGAMTLYSLCRLPKTPRRSIEVKLFIHSFTNSSTMMLFSIFSFWFGFFPNVYNMRDKFNNMICLPLDCILCVSPYALIVCSTDLQERLPLISRLLKKSSSPVQISVQSLNS